MAKFTVACIGLGMRAEIYLSLMSKKEEYEIVSFCDLLQNKIDYYSDKFKVAKANCFTNEEEFFSKKRADLCVVATQDKDHAGHLLKALKAGYKRILVEKPFCTTLDDIKDVSDECKKQKAEIYVCHVLRYAPAFMQAKKWLSAGKIGKLISISGIERITMAHFAHSYVRGHYGVLEKSSPSIMAKCCHDLDLLVWYADSLCDSLSSTGGLEYFKKENAPKDSADRCQDCKVKNNCYFSTENIYFKELLWAKEYATYNKPVTDESLRKDLKTNQFGRCVFHCDNNVADQQFVNIVFKNGVRASFEMTAFTPYAGRRYVFNGTEGEILLDESQGLIQLKRWGEETISLSISQLVDSKSGHGGGDAGLIDNLTRTLLGDTTVKTSTIDYALESHRMALIAEISRNNSGERIKLDQFKI